MRGRGGSDAGSLLFLPVAVRPGQGLTVALVLVHGYRCFPIGFPVGAVPHHRGSNATMNDVALVLGFDADEDDDLLAAVGDLVDTEPLQLDPAQSTVPRGLCVAFGRNRVMLVGPLHGGVAASLPQPDVRGGGDGAGEAGGEAALLVSVDLEGACLGEGTLMSCTVIHLLRGAVVTGVVSM